MGVRTIGVEKRPRRRKGKRHGDRVTETLGSTGRALEGGRGLCRLCKVVRGAMLDRAEPKRATHRQRFYMLRKCTQRFGDSIVFITLG